MAIRWRADDGLLIVVFAFSLPSSTKKVMKKNVVKIEMDPLWQNFLDPRMNIYVCGYNPIEDNCIDKLNKVKQNDDRTW